MPTPDVMPHPAAVEFLLSYLIAPERNISLTERNVHLQSNKDLSLNPEETGRMNGRRGQEIEEELDLIIPFLSSRSGEGILRLPLCHQDTLKG